MHLNQEPTCCNSDLMQPKKKKKKIMKKKIKQSNEVESSVCVAVGEIQLYTERSMPAPEKMIFEMNDKTPARWKAWTIPSPS